MLQVGLIGLPNVGKSTLFNALSPGHGHADVSNYPFCTLDANVAIVPVPEPRLDRLAEVFGQETRVPAAVKFLDIAGLVRNAHQGEGLGNQFLGHLREVDAVLHVVRCFEDPQVVHVDGWVDPVRDVATIEQELLQADRGTLERRLEKARSQARSGQPEDREALALTESLLAWISGDNGARDWPEKPAHPDFLRELCLLTDKPFLYLANAPEDCAGEHVSALQTHADAVGAKVLSLPAKLAADVAELEPEEAQEFMAELGLDQSALATIIRAAYELLDQLTFFTGVGAELTAWAARRGTPLGKAVGKIHSDMETGFIKAEVVPFAALDECGSWAAAREHGKLHVKGREQPVEEGDVVYVHFKPGG